MCGWAKIRDEVAASHPSLHVPGQTRSGKCESSQGCLSSAWAGAHYRVGGLFKFNFQGPGQVLLVVCAPADMCSLCLASRVVRRIWLSLQGAPTTHRGSTGTERLPQATATISLILYPRALGNTEGYTEDREPVLKKKIAKGEPNPQILPHTEV